jgi:quinol---cytochrome-c reductase cytochrome b subunit
VIADKLQIPLYTVTWIARVLVIAGSVIAYIVTRRVCLGLRLKDAQTLEHGVGTGIIRQLPDGGFTEVTEQVSDKARAVLSAKPAVHALPAADASGVPAPGGTGMAAKFRALANAVFTETAAAAETNGHATDTSHDRVGGQGEQVRPASPAGKAPAPLDPDRSA